MIINWGLYRDWAECLFTYETITAEFLDAVDHQLDLPEDQMRFAKLIVRANHYGLYALIFAGPIDETIKLAIESRISESLDGSIIQVFMIMNTQETACYLLKKDQGIVFQYSVENDMFQPLTVFRDIDTNSVLLAIKQ